MGGKKKIKTGLGHSLLKDRFSQNANKRTVGENSMVRDNFFWAMSKILIIFYKPNSFTLQKSTTAMTGAG
jgi:hypothetical protein